MTQNHAIPRKLQIAQTPAWSVNHRVKSALPGYLIITSTKATNDLSDLSVEALGSMGIVFAEVQRALTMLGAQRVYISRYGHSPDYQSISTQFQYFRGWKSYSGRMNATDCWNSSLTSQARRRLTEQS